jgi:hypothetical protein
MNRRQAIKNTVLTGSATILGTSLFSLLHSCKAEDRLTWTPAFLKPDHARLISSLVDTLLPATATPGGLDVKVDVFIDKVFHKMYNEAGQLSIIADMDNFNERCKERFGKVFYKLTNEQKKEFLMSEEQSSPKFNSGVWGTAVGDQKPVGFYRSIKSMAIWGYCSCEEIGKNVLAYDPVPQMFNGCYPVSEIETIWSL